MGKSSVCVLLRQDLPQPQLSQTCYVAKDDFDLPNLQCYKDAPGGGAAVMLGQQGWISGSHCPLLYIPSRGDRSQL